MSDGVVIMLIGMGVVFLFLIILLVFIRLIARSDRDASHGRQVSAVPDKPQLAGQANTDSFADSSAHSSADHELELIAAVAVALELSLQDSTEMTFEPSVQGHSTWRQSGRLGMFRGPRVVGQVLRARRGRN